MRKRLPVSGCLLLYAVCLVSIASAHVTWQRTYGGQGDDEGNSIQQTTDGGFIVAGYTESFGAGDADVYLIKTNAQGDTLWTRTFGGPDYDEGYSVQQTTDGGYIVAGLTYSYGAGNDDVYLIKTNAQGDTLWTRTYGGPRDDESYSVEQTTDGGYIVAGLTYSYGAGYDDLYLIKTNAQGDTVWTRTYGGTYMDEGSSVQQTADGGYIVAGTTSSFGAGDANVWLIKTNASGDTLWTRTSGRPGHDEGRSVQQTADGGYVIGGFTSRGAGSGGYYLVKTDAQGDTLWTRAVGWADWDAGYSVQQTTDGGYIIAGIVEFPFDPGSYDVGLVKTDASGDTLWTRTYGGGIQRRRPLRLPDC